MIHGSQEETDMQMKHEITAVHACLRATVTKMAMIHATDMAKDTTPDSVGQNNKLGLFELSHFAMTEDTIARTLTLTIEMHKRPQSPYQSRQNAYTSNYGQPIYNNITRSLNQTCTHCKRTNHTSRE